MNLTADQLVHETDVTWLRPTCLLPRYVRETLAMANRRRGTVKYTGTVVGWANLSRKAKSSGGVFLRRVFWVETHDPYVGGGAPCEAVDPYTVTPGTPGVLTDRAADRRGHNHQHSLTNQPQLRERT